MAEKKIVDRMLEIGLGIAAYSEEKLSDFLKEISAKGEATRGEVTRLKKELQVKGKEFRNEFMKRLKKEMEASLKKMNLATTADIAALKKRVDDLEGSRRL